MEIQTAITLLTINVIVLSLVIITLIVAAIVLSVKLNKIASNVQQTAANIVNVTNWLSPVKVFGELSKALRSIKKR
ncbi:MAG: hypothetical protein WAR37_00515 [Candidatus Microsaccharimonas sp.]